MVNMSTMGTEEKFKEVVYLGEITYKKKWPTEKMSEDDRKHVLLTCVKEVFDSQVYSGARCNNESCQSKKCPEHRAINIVMVRHPGQETTTTTTRSIMIHAYQTGPEGEGVFQRLMLSQGDPIKLLINAHTYDEETKQLKRDCQGHIAQVTHEENLKETKKLMKMALREESQADVIALQSEGYVDNNEQ